MYTSLPKGREVKITQKWSNLVKSYMMNLFCSNILRAQIVHYSNGSNHSSEWFPGYTFNFQIIYYFLAHLLCEQIMSIKFKRQNQYFSVKFWYLFWYLFWSKVRSRTKMFNQIYSWAQTRLSLIQPQFGLGPEPDLIFFYCWQREECMWQI